MDIYDRAQENQITDIADAIDLQKLKSATATRIQPTGECLNPECCEPFEQHEAERLFCGPECALKYEKYHNQGNASK